MRNTFGMLELLWSMIPRFCYFPVWASIRTDYYRESGEGQVES